MLLWYHCDMARISTPTKRRHERPAVQRVNVDFPRELLEAIDAEATRLAIPRQAFIKLRLADSLKERAS